MTIFHKNIKNNRLKDLFATMGDHFNSALGGKIAIFYQLIFINVSFLHQPLILTVKYQYF